MTVEKRAMTGVCTPGARRKSAHVRLEMSCVTWQQFVIGLTTRVGYSTFST